MTAIFEEKGDERICSQLPTIYSEHWNPTSRKDFHLSARGFDALLFFRRIGGMVLRLSCNLEALAVGFPEGHVGSCGETLPPSLDGWMLGWLDGSVLQSPKLFMERLHH